MATYIKGVTDVMPKLAPVQVDYKLLSTSLAALQNRYNKGAEQVRSVYNSLINKPVSSPDNEEFRRDYLKKADSYLSQLAGVDLANAGNVQQAMNLFNPLTEDPQFSRDLYLTGAQDSQIQKMMTVKNSTDEKVRKQWSQIMEDYLMIGKNRLREMKRDDGSIEKASVNMYSPWEDPIEYASGLAEKDGLKFERTIPNGMYMVYTLNGEKSLGTYKNWFANVIGNKFDNQFRIEAEVDNEKAVRNLMAKNPALDRTAAMRELATVYSNTYVQTYNQQIDDVQERIEELNAIKRKYQNKYPNGVPPQIAQEIAQMKEEKDFLSNSLESLIRDKGDDQTFAQRAMDIYMNNPAGAAVPAIKDRYSNRFAQKQAFGATDVKYSPDQVAMQEDSQKHAWAMQKDRQAFERSFGLEKMQLEFQYDIEKMKLKNEIPGLATGAAVGQPQDVGALGVDKYYNSLVQTYYKKGTEPFVNDKALAIAANIKIDQSAGNTIDYDNNPIDMQSVQSAILNISKGTALLPKQKEQLNLYIKMVSPGTNLNASNVNFPILQDLITGAIRKNSNNYPNLGKSVLQDIYNANIARTQYGEMWQESKTHLTSVLRNRPDLKPYVTVGSLGGMFINYAAVDALDVKDRESIYRALIPSYDKYSGERGKQMSTVVLNPSDPSKFDFSILRSVLDNAAVAGVTNSKGEFIRYNETQLSQLRNITLGRENMKAVFDPNQTTYERKTIDGADYIKVTMPVIRTSTGKGGSVATTMGFDLNGEIEKNNRLELLVPVGKAANLAGADVIAKDRITGVTYTQPNEFRTLVTELAGRDLVPQATSWVTKNGLLSENGTSPFPPYLQSYIKGGRLYTQANNIYAEYLTDDGKLKSHNLTDILKISLSDLERNPAGNDAQIRTFIESGLQNVKDAIMTNAHNEINNNAIKARTTVGYTKWRDIKW